MQSWPQRPQFSRNDRLQAPLAAYGDEVTGTMQECILYCFFARVAGERNYRDLGIEAVFLLDDIADGIGVAVAVDDQELDLVIAERVTERLRAIDPMAVRRVTGVS